MSASDLEFCISASPKATRSCLLLDSAVAGRSLGADCVAWGATVPIIGPRGKESKLTVAVDGPRQCLATSDNNGLGMRVPGSLAQLMYRLGSKSKLSVLRFQNSR